MAGQGLVIAPFANRVGLGARTLDGGVRRVLQVPETGLLRLGRTCRAVDLGADMPIPVWTSTLVRNLGLFAVCCPTVSAYLRHLIARLRRHRNLAFGGLTAPGDAHIVNRSFHRS